MLISDMLEVPYSFIYHPLTKVKGGTGLIALPNGKNDKDWIISRLFLNLNALIWNMSQRLPGKCLMD